jgi:hypothetical protein
MDIKSLSELLTGKPAAAESGDLLAQLKAAGTIKAEVIRVLQGKLLLSSRLGEILTTNTLNYKPGDQINLRLGGDEQNPVLKASPVIPRPITLDSGQNPRLSRALPPDQSVLAVVSRITAQRIEIRLAGQILTLPRAAGITRNQLLVLQRNDAMRSIEITPLDRKLIYKGLLKQLVPDQHKSASTSLVRLLRLVTEAVNTVQPKAVPESDPSLQAPAKTLANTPRQAPAKTLAETPGLVPQSAIPRIKNQPSTTSGETQSTSKPNARALLPAASKPDLSVLTTPAGNKSMPAQNNRLLNLLLRQVNKVDTRSSSAINLVKPIVPGTGSTPRTASNKSPIVPQKLSLPGIEKISARVTNGKHIANSASGSTHNSLPTQPQPTLANNHLALVDGVTSRKVNPGQLQPQASTPPTLLQTLLQMVPKLADIDAQQIKQWFEFASLIRAPKTRSSASLSTDSLQTLKPLVDKNAFSRELELSIQPRTKSTAANETPTVKPMPQEILLAQVRDGVKLVEQALSQNLLQRVSLGMQHETQQPLSLNFALPFIDQQEVKPLYVDLKQRDQPQEDKDKSWDIRLSFDLADLGPVACHIFLQDEAVAASFYCEKSQTRTRVEQALPELKQQLSVAGFTVGEFHSFPGKPVQSQTSTATSYTESLIDIEV